MRSTEFWRFRWACCRPSVTLRWPLAGFADVTNIAWRAFLGEKSAVVVLLRRHTQCEESVQAADWLNGPPFVWQLGHVTIPTADWPLRLSLIGTHWNICVWHTRGVFDLQWRSSSLLAIVSWPRLIDINDDELGPKVQAHTYLMTTTTHILNQFSDYHTEVNNVNVSAACGELAASFV